MKNIVSWTLCAVAAALGCAATLGCAGAQPRSPAPRAVVEAKFAAVNRHAISEVVQFYGSEVQLTASDFCAPRNGREDVRRTYAALFGAYPDILAEVTELVTEGDRVVVRLIVRGTAGGRAFAIPIANFLTVRNGLIVRDDGVFDTAGRPCTR